MVGRTEEKEKNAGCIIISSSRNKKIISFDTVLKNVKVLATNNNTPTHTRTKSMKSTV